MEFDASNSATQARAGGAGQLFSAAAGKRLLSGRAVAAKLTKIARLADRLRRPLQLRAEQLLPAFDAAALRAETAAAAAEGIALRFRSGAARHLPVFERERGVVDEERLRTGSLGAAAAWGDSLKRSPLTDFAVAAVAAALPENSPGIPCMEFCRDEPPLGPKLSRQLRRFYDAVVEPEYGALLERGNGEISPVVARLMRTLEAMGSQLLGLREIAAGTEAGSESPSNSPVNGSLRWAMNLLGENWNGEIRTRLGAEAEITGGYGLSLTALMMEIAMTPSNFNLALGPSERERFLLEMTIFVDAMNQIAGRVDGRRRARETSAAAPAIQAGDLQTVVAAMEIFAEESPALWGVMRALLVGMKRATQKLWGSMNSSVCQELPGSIAPP